MKNSCVILAGLLTVATAALPALGDNWTIRMTVDNRYDAYLGTSTATTSLVGSDANWPTMETYNVTGVNSTDFWYVTTSSDRSVAQGFLASFTNTTTAITINTGSVAWQVFRAGDHLLPIFGTPNGAWPTNLQPTVSQTDAAIAYATANNLWTATASSPGYTNPGAGPWGAFPLISGSARWVWAPDSTGGNPLQPGANHGEFLIFRIEGQAIPTPAAAALLGLGGLMAVGRRRR